MRDNGSAIVMVSSTKFGEYYVANYTIENFWKPRLNVDRIPSEALLEGWSSLNSGLDTFKEAPLTLSAELSHDSDPARAPILLVSAPGAVGKSTLARQIAFVTGAIYVDLAKADPVGGNTLSGGLVKSGLFQKWESLSTAIIIDGLDEARLRVTQEALEAFLRDVAELAMGRKLPTIMFGRTGAIQDAWLALADSDVGVAVMEIGYYGPEASLDFAVARLHAANPHRPHEGIERKALKLLLARLRAQTESDGDRFAGYAPVLQAVAERVAKDENVGAIIAHMEQGEVPITLRTVVSAILERERGKLSGLPFQDKSLANILYSPDEQLDRLVARLYGGPQPVLPAMQATDAQIYDGALDTWVAEHPFFDGAGGTSSAVFDAMISIRALRNPASAETALQRELSRGVAANPFLSEFYGPENPTPDPVFLPPQHIGIVYASIRARMSLGDTASLLVEGPEEAKEEEALRAEVEITVARRGANQPRILYFDSDQTNPIHLGTYIDDVDITVPHTNVEIGPGPEAVLIAPINIQCEKLSIKTDRVIVENPPENQAAAVYLETEMFEGSQMFSVPVLRGEVTLSASWPGVRAHPWTSFATDPTPIEDNRVDETLRRLRKFVIAFRSHSKGRLARFRGKIEHRRMTKGSGDAVLQLLLVEKVLSLEGQMYFLNPDRLMAQTGATHADCLARRFGAEAVAFAGRALETAN